MPACVNISAYKFTPLGDLPAMRARLLAGATAAELKGTILLSHEGINLFLAGEPRRINSFLAELRATSGFADLAVKESPSDDRPFGRLRVKIKKEIITLGVDGIEPARHPARRLAPETLKQWLDEGRPIVLLDTRNDYEVRLGTFAGARAAGIARFRDFPRAVGALPDEMKQRPIVTFCTGGIRCEKAAPLMEREGFRDVYQLDGGILKYFERCGGAHFEGECFVFDERVGVADSLRESRARLCPSCQLPLAAVEPACPRCP